LADTGQEFVHGHIADIDTRGIARGVFHGVSRERELIATHNQIWVLEYVTTIERYHGHSLSLQSGEKALSRFGVAFAHESASLSSKSVLGA
jgi:hypothetical protein